MPGDPIDGLLSRMQAHPPASEALTGYYTKAFGFDVPIWKQYLNFWAALFHGDLGRSIAYVPTSVSELIWAALPVHARAARAGDPAQLLGREQGRRDGRAPEGARQHGAPRRVRADGDAADVARDRALASSSHRGGSSRSPARTASRCSRRGPGVRGELPLATGSCRSCALPRRLRRLGDRDAEHDHLRARGRLLELPRGARARRPSSCASTPTATHCCRRSRGSRSRSARSSRARSSSRSCSRIPGSGRSTLTAIQNRDYFLIQGIFLFIIVGVLIANFIIDIAYVFIDPRTRVGMQGGADGGRRTTRRRARPAARPGLATPARRSRAGDLRRPAASAPSSLYFALRNWKFVSGSPSCSSSSLLAIVGPLLTERTTARVRRPPDQPPSSDYWFGTTSFGQDVFSQFVLRAARQLPRRRRSAAASRWLLGMAVGFTAGYRGGVRRRRPEHAHERRARDPDARDPDHRRRLPERAQLCDGGAC